MTAVQSSGQSTASQCPVGVDAHPGGDCRVEADAHPRGDCRVGDGYTLGDNCGHELTNGSWPGPPTTVDHGLYGEDMPLLHNTDGFVL